MTDASELRRELARARQRGYAEANGEYVPGLFGVAAPIVDSAGVLVAVVTVAGPAFRMRPHRRDIRDAVRSAVKRIALEYARVTPDVEA